MDLFITDRKDMIINLDLAAPFGKSDHVCLVYSIDRAQDIDKKKDSRHNYYKGNYGQMQQELSDVDWENTLKDMNIDQAWCKFEEFLRSSIEKNVPLARKFNSNKKKWMTKDARSAVKQKHKAYNKYRKHKNQENLDVYKRAKNHAIKVTRDTRQNYETTLAANLKDNPKEFWSYVKSQTGTVSKIAPITNKDGTLAIDNTDKANTLNEFFASVFTKENTDAIPTSEQD